MAHGISNVTPALLAAFFAVGAGISFPPEPARAAPTPSLSYFGDITLMATPGAMATPFPNCPAGQGCTSSFNPVNSTEEYLIQPTTTGSSFTQPSTTLSITSPLSSGGPVGNTFGGTVEFGTNPFSTFSSSTANGPSSFSIGNGMSASSSQIFSFTDFITPQATATDPIGTPITVNISAQLNQLLSGVGGFNPTPPGACTGNNETVLNSAANINLTMTGGIFLQNVLCDNMPTRSGTGSISAIVGTAFELDGRLGIGTSGEIGAALTVGASTSIDETHTTVLALSAPVPLASASGASYVGPTSVPEPSTFLLLGGIIAIFGMVSIRRRPEVSN
jgi:hypothetical protein